MTERSLLVRCANLGPYCIIGTDYPSARVFDSRRSALVSVVEEPPRSRLVNNTSAFATTLTSVALGAQASATPKADASAKAKRARAAAATVTDAADTALEVYYAAMGLSNGTVVLHNVTRDEHVDHIAVCETQHALISLTFEGNYLFCLSANCFLYVVDVTRRQCVLRGRCQNEASSLAVSPVAATGQQLFRVLVSGPTMAVYEIALQASEEGEDGQQVQRGVCRKLLSFASQGTRVDLSWLSTRAFASAASSTSSASSSSCGEVAALTASAQEGTIRVWDVREDTMASKASGTQSAARTASVLIGRCRRTLLCGQRMANLSVLEGPAHCFVAATTVTGSLLLWDLGASLLPVVAETAPLVPHYVFVSDASAKSAAPRLLYGAILQATADHDVNDTVELGQLRLLLLHGRFALPRFGAARVDALLESHRVACESISPQEVRARAAAAASRAALGFFHSTNTTSEMDTQLITLPASVTEAGLAAQDDASARPTTGVDAAFATADSVWLHQQQQLAAKAASTPTESFRAMSTFHAASMKDLPVKQMTLEQRLRRLANEAATSAAISAKYGALEHGGATTTTTAEEETDEMAMATEMETGIDRTHSASLGLATVPLYQALHAGDTAAVMELLSVAARSAEGMKATVLSLQLPYVLQLLKVLSERLGIVSNRTTKSTSGDSTSAEAEATISGGSASVSTRSPLLAWVDAIVRYRGMEMYAAQQATTAAATPATTTTSASKDTAAATTAAPVISPPRDFLAPLLHQYRAVCSQYDTLATVYGRMSIFNAVRPTERSSFVNRAPLGSANSNLELLRDVRGRKAGSDALATETAAKLHKLHGHGDVLAEDIAFPANFKEVRTYKGGSRVVRVRSRVSREKRQHAQINSDRALLRRARQMAAEKSKSGGGGLLDSDDDDDGEEDDMMMKAMLEANDGEIDMDALEDNMRLDSDDDASMDDDDDDEEGEDDADELDIAQARKRARQERSGKRAVTSDVMLADDTRRDGESDEDPDAMELDSSEAEFSAGSDDDVHSEVLDFSEDEKGSSGSSSEDEDDNDDDNDARENVSGDEGKDGGSASDDEDGMGDDMKALIEEEGLESAGDRRKHKRVRLD